MYHPSTQQPLEDDGVTPFDPYRKDRTPWKTRVLTEGPDVMFAVADLEGEEGTVEVIASQFFTQEVSVHSIKLGSPEGPSANPETPSTLPEVVFSRTIDSSCGYAYSSVLCDLKTSPRGTAVDDGSTAPRVSDCATHVVVSTHEETYEYRETPPPSGISHQHPVNTPETPESANPNGGSVFAYEIPKDWKTDTWKRSTIAGGFKCKSPLSIRPGAPGFVYLFNPAGVSTTNTGGRPYIALAGDGTESAYIYRPTLGGECWDYELMFEIEAGGTVGSMAVEYGEFAGAEEGCAKIFVASYERDKIFAFAFQRIREEGEGGGEGRGKTK